MPHLTLKQVQDLADGLTATEAAARHAAQCPRCAREVAIQRSLSRAAKEAPAARPSSRFARRVMDAVAPGQNESFVFRLLGGTGKFFAMILVLGVIGLALNYLPGSVVPQNDQSSLGKFFSDSYQLMSDFFTRSSTEASQAVSQQTSGESGRAVAITIVSLLVLIILDRFLEKRIIRHKH